MALILIVAAAAAAICCDAARLAGQPPSFARELTPPSVTKVQTINAAEVAQEGAASGSPSSVFQEPIIQKPPIFFITAHNADSFSYAMNVEREQAAIARLSERYDVYTINVPRVPCVISADGYFHLVDCFDTMPGTKPIERMLSEISRRDTKLPPFGSEPQGRRQAQTDFQSAVTTGGEAKRDAIPTRREIAPQSITPDNTSPPATEVQLGEPAPLVPVPDPRFAK